MTTNTNLFNRLVIETKKLSTAPIPTLSRGRLKRWTDLADFWEANPATFPNLFYEAIFHIARDRHSMASVTLKPMLHLIEEAILTDLDALGVWRERHDFRCAFGSVIHGIYDAPYSSQRWKSNAIRHFIENKLRVLIMYRGKPLPQLNLKLIRNRRAYWSVRKQLEARSVYARFVEFMELLVPNCCRWTLGQWTSEKYIFSQIKAVHGIDFAQHVADFDSLFFLFKNKSEGLPYYKNLFSIRNIPASIANAIWGANMEREICEQFNIACTVKPRLHQGKFYKFDCIYPQNMVKSWAFQQMSVWYKTKPNLLTSTARSNLMNIGLGNHPWCVTHGLPTAV